jgi:hypothetical protein
LGREDQAFRKGALLKDGKVWECVPCRLHRRYGHHISYEEAASLRRIIPLKPLNTSNTLKVNVEPLAPHFVVSCPECNLPVKVYCPSFPFEGITTCRNCGTKFYLKTNGVGSPRMELMFPSIKELESIWGLLTSLEQSRLEEASKCFGVKAYTMCESACFDALVSILRRIYGGREELGHYIPKMERDPDLREEAGFISSFKTIRDKVDHPVRVSTQLDAKSTFETTKRLIRVMAKKKLKESKES